MGVRIGSTRVGKVRYMTAKYVPPMVNTEVNAASSGTEGSVGLDSVTVGNLLLVAVMRRSSVVSVTSGWTKLTQSPTLSAYTQTVDIYYKIATSTFEVFNIVTSASGRVICAMAEFITDVVPVEDTSVSITSETYNTLTYTKPNNKCYFMAASVQYYDNAAPYGLWAYSPIVKTHEYLTTVPNRLFVWVDDAEPIAQTISTTITTTGDGYEVIMCGVYWE